MEMLPTRPHHDLWFSLKIIVRNRRSSSLRWKHLHPMRGRRRPQVPLGPAEHAVQHHGVRIRDQEPKAWLGSQPLIGLELRALIPLCCPEPVPPTGRLMIVWGFRSAVSPEGIRLTRRLSYRAAPRGRRAVAWAKAYCQAQGPVLANRFQQEYGLRVRPLDEAKHAAVDPIGVGLCTLAGSAR